MQDDDFDDPDERVWDLTMIPYPGMTEDEMSEYWTFKDGISSVSVTVVDNDLPLVGVEPVQDSYPEDRSGEFRVTRVGQTTGPLAVKARITETGNSYSDQYEHFLGIERTYAFTANRQSTYWRFTLQGRDGDEADGSLTFHLLPGDGYRVDPERSVATFVVTDTDPSPTLAVTDATVSEDAGNIDFHVSLSSSLSPPSRQTVTVDYVTVGGTAEAGEDYTHVAGTLSIGPRQTSAVISVPVLDNRLIEETEAFSLELSNPVNTELQDGQTMLTAVGTIRDNEPFVSVTGVEDEIEEGEPAVFEFTRTGSAAEALTVYFVAGFEDGRAEWESTEIPAGQSSVRWSFPTVENDLDGPDLTYGVFIIPPSWRALPRYYDSEFDVFWVMVKDDDLPVVTIVADQEGRTEGESAAFTLTREGLLDQPLTVNVSVAQVSDNTGVEANFISGTVPTTMAFAAGSATATLTVSTSDDSLTEPHATIAAAITAPGSGDDDDAYRLGDPASADVRISDDDRANTASLSLSAQSGVVEEGEDAVFIVTRTGNTSVDLTARVRVTEIKQNVAPDAQKLLQITVTEMEATFQAGDATATLAVATEDEQLNDGNSRIKAGLLLSGLYAIYPFPSIANIWVRDNDIPTISFADAQSEHIEDPDNYPTYTLVRTGDTSYTVEVNLTRRELLRYAQPIGDRVFDSQSTHPRPIFAGQDRATWRTTPGLVGPRGGQALVRIHSGYCEEVPGDCRYSSQYRVGEISTTTIEVHNSAQGVLIETDQVSVNEGESVAFTLTRIGGSPGARTNGLTVQVIATQDGEFIQGVSPQTVYFTGFPDVRGGGRCVHGEGDHRDRRRRAVRTRRFDHPDHPPTRGKPDLFLLRNRRRPGRGDSGRRQ